MKHLLLASVLLGGLSCASNDDELKYHHVQTEVHAEAVTIDAPSSGVQYMAWSTSEERALSDWVDSRSTADSKGSEYAREHPDRPWTVLWRQKPDGKQWKHK